MGALSKALSPQSSAGAKRAGLWDEITDAVGGCLYLSRLLEVEEWIASIELQIPVGWREPIEEIIEKKRDELQDTDISKIIRDRYDF